MAATLGGMMRAPIMATVFAYELTHDANALLPVLAASVVAYGFTVITMHRSILTEKIARRGHHIYREYGIDPLERHSVEEVMTATPVSIDADARVGEVLASYFGSGQRHRAFPVTKGGAVLGMLDRAALEQAGDAVHVRELYGVNAPIVALRGETCRTVAIRLAVHGLERLPVVADAESRQLVGIISRSDMIKSSLALENEEHRRHRFRRFTLTS